MAGRSPDPAPRKTPEKSGFLKGLLKGSEVMKQMERRLSHTIRVCMEFYITLPETNIAPEKLPFQ